MVECGGLENRCPPTGGPGVRIPLPPQKKCNPVPIKSGTGFCFMAKTQALLKVLAIKQKTAPRSGGRDYISFARTSPNGILKSSLFSHPLLNERPADPISSGMKGLHFFCKDLPEWDIEIP